MSSNQRRQPCVCTQRSANGPFGLSRKKRYSRPLRVVERRRVGRVGDCRPGRRSGTRSRRASPHQGQGISSISAPPPAAPCSSISAPVVKRSSANGALSACGSPLRDRVREHPARAGRRLEAARAPAAVDVQAVDRRRPDDRRRVGADVDDAGPGPQHARPREDREQLERRRHLVLDHVERAALAVASCRRRCPAPITSSPLCAWLT